MPISLLVGLLWVAYVRYGKKYFAKKNGLMLYALCVRTGLYNVSRSRSSWLTEYENTPTVNEFEL